MKPETIAAFGTISYSAVLPTQFPQMDSVCEAPRTSPQVGQTHNRIVTVIQSSRPRPWIRYWARAADVALAGFAFALFAGVAGVDVAHWNSFAFGWLAVMLWIPFEAAFLCACATTPGKWLFNIRLTKPDSSNLTFQQALGRAITVLVKGQGLGIPVVSFFTQIAAWGRLNRFAATSWDQQYEVVVRHEPIGAGRILAILATVVVFLAIIGLSNAANDPGIASGLNVMSY
jgi:uncharacterized RDD family membrane protein YckC